MGTQTNAPQWFLASFVRSVRGAGATASEDEIRGVGQNLIDRWSEPQRHFHNLRHLADVLRRVDQLADETHDPDLVRLAAWYHGAVFKVFKAKSADSQPHKGGEDESASAKIAVVELTALGVPDASVRRVGELVNALVRHMPNRSDFDCAVLCDADLAILAAEPQRYREYLKEVREEYSHIPVTDYVDTRITILTRLLARPSLFTSPLGTDWEEPARQNIDAELQRLRKEQARLAAQ